MADETPGGLAAAIKAFEELLKKVTSPLPAEEESSAPSPPPPAAPETDAQKPKKKVADEAESMAARARKKYDGTLKWVLGLFSAVGLLVFGSVPFTNLAEVDFWPWAGVGLIAVGAGLICVIIGTTQGLELQDASLGELAHTLDGAEGKRPGWFRPRKRAAYDLREILSGNEASAHLGPGVTTVPELIARIGELEQRIMAEQVGWGGTGGPPTPTQLAGSTRSRLFVAELASKEATASKARIEELRTSLSATTPPPGQTVLQEALQDEVARYGDLLALAPPSSEAERRGRLDALRMARRRYLAHRELLLDESLVSQMRGTYRVVWRWLIIGGALTLAGGVSYAWAIGNPEDPSTGLRSAVTVDLVKDSKAWKAAKDCLGAGQVTDVQDLPGLLVSSDDQDGRQDGPFTFVVTKDDCEGQSIDVAEGDGAYQPKAPAAPTPPASSSAPPPTSPTSGALTSVTPPRVVRVQLRANTPAWRKARACRPSSSSRDLRNLRALLTARSLSDEQRDGPFAVRVTDARCGGTALDLTVAEGDGGYRLTPRAR